MLRSAFVLVLGLLPLQRPLQLCLRPIHFHRLINDKNTTYMYSKRKVNMDMKFEQRRVTKQPNLGKSLAIWMPQFLELF